MPASVAILAKPDDHRGILTMSEAVEAMLAAFREWVSDPLIAELRRRTHTPKNVRITLHQGNSKVNVRGTVERRILSMSARSREWAGSISRPLSTPTAG